MGQQCVEPLAGIGRLAQREGLEHAQIAFLLLDTVNRREFFVLVHLLLDPRLPSAIRAAEPIDGRHEPEVVERREPVEPRPDDPERDGGGNRFVDHEGEQVEVDFVANRIDLLPCGGQLRDIGFGRAFGHPIGRPNLLKVRRQVRRVLRNASHHRWPAVQRASARQAPTPGKRRCSR